MKMIEKERYDVVLGALILACEVLYKVNMEVTTENLEMLRFKMVNSLMGYFLMKAEESLKNDL